MELRVLKSFVVVVECKSFTDAAKKIFLSQPTISTHIKLLENELNVELIHRDRHKIIPTKKGLELYEYAKKMLVVYDEFMEENKMISSNTIRIGASTIPSCYCLPDFIVNYKSKHNEVIFKVIQFDSEKVINSLQENDIDVGLIGMDCNIKNIICESFLNDKLVLIVASNGEYSYLKNLSRKELLFEITKVPFIMREDGSGSRIVAEKALKSLGIDILDMNISSYINNQELLIDLVKSSIGISIVSKEVVKDYEKNGSIFVIDLQTKLCERKLNIIYKNNIKNKQIKNFILYVKDFYKNSVDKC